MPVEEITKKDTSDEKKFWRILKHVKYSSLASDL